MLCVLGHYEWLRSPDEYLSNEMVLVDLDAGTTYQVRVVAKNGDGYESGAVWLEFHTPGVGQWTKTRFILVEFVVVVYIGDGGGDDGGCSNYYALPLIGGGIKWCFCLTSVCLTYVVYIGPKSRTERPRKTKIDTEVAHITRDSDTTFRVKRSKVKVTRPLWLAVQVTTRFIWTTP